MTPRLELRLLGYPELRSEVGPLPCRDTGLRILAILALDGPQERLKLADLLWEGSSERVLHNLRMALLKLRRTLGQQADLLKDSNQFLHLDLSRLWVDALQAPQQPDELLRHWQEFMSGQRCKGSENWLEWANQTEERLLAGHIQQLQTLTPAVPAAQRQHLEQRASYLSRVLQGEEPPVPRPMLALQAPAPQMPQPVKADKPPLGREAMLEQILQATERRQMVMLVGEAGSGKSVLQQAIDHLENMIVPSEWKPTDSRRGTQVFEVHQFTGGHPELLTSLPAHFQQIGPEARQVLRLAALCEDPFSFSVSLACEVLGQSEQQVLDAVEHLYHHGYFLGCSVHPPAVREVVVQSMPEPTRLHLIHKLRQSHAAWPGLPIPSPILKN